MATDSGSRIDRYTLHGKMTYMRSTALMPIAVTILHLAAAPAHARVVHIAVDHTETVGAYTKQTGHFFGELDPKLPLNAIINDISLAPRNDRGRVEYSATFTLMYASDPARISGVIMYEVPNRGNSPLNARIPEDGLAAGHAMLSSGWQGDLSRQPGLETLSVPVAKNPDGSSITGPVMASLMNLPANSTTASLMNGYAALRYQRPVTLDPTKAQLTRQWSDDGEAIPVAAKDWAFADCSKTPFPGDPDPTKICLRGGFDATQMYRVVYSAKDPLVLGIGVAATRDIISFFRYATKDDQGTANPLAGKIRYSVGFCTSQSGNFIKTFQNLGFNQDESKKIVWDGVNPNIAARQTPMNFRFAIPGGAANLYEPGSEGVLWWSDYRDQERGRPAAGLLDRCTATKTCPKIVETLGATEFWGLRMSPGLVGTRADTDIPLPANVRRYYFPGVTHGGGRGGFQVIGRDAAGRGCALPDNPNSTAEAMRALRRALIDWIVKNAPPPESKYPMLSRGELVPPVHTTMGFPVIPGAPLPDNLINTFYDYDLGPDFLYNDLSGAISIQPPIVKRTIPMLVPKTDADGNEIGGVPSVLHQAPLGTYLGWNVTASGYLKGRGCGFSGGMIPFARTKAEREALSDPRPSLEERYGTHENYVAQVKAAAQSLVQQRFLVQEDADRLVLEADASGVLR